MSEMLKYQIDLDVILLFVLTKNLICIFYLIFFLFFTVLDDEDSNNITVGSLVTVLVKLTRQTMAVRNLFVFLCFKLYVKVFVFIFLF